MKISKKMNSEETFNFLVEEYLNDKHFCIPTNVREIYSKYNEATLFILLGKSFFSWQFLLAAKEILKNILIVDDYNYNNGSQMLGVEIISFDKLESMSKNQNNIVAINCCPPGNAQQFFQRNCILKNIPIINYDQASRLISLNSGLDYRVEDWGEYISKNKFPLVALSKVFADKQSVETMFGILNYQLSCDLSHVLNVARSGHSLYFHSNFFNFSENEKFVDCGAANGDTIKSFMDVTQSQIARAWLVEPAPVHHESLLNLARSLRGGRLDGKVTIHQCAIGDTEFTASFNQDGNGSRIGEDGGVLKVPVKKLDNFIDEAPTFIKMDIEGYELSALKGAAKLLEESSPKMAVSAYHRSSDFIDIVSYVTSVDPEYKVGMRHHSNERWETCLYFYK